jgi:hypothetical protein
LFAGRYIRHDFSCRRPQIDIVLVAPPAKKDNGAQDADDGDDYHQFNECKALVRHYRFPSTKYYIPIFPNLFKRNPLLAP